MANSMANSIANSKIKILLIYKCISINTRHLLITYTRMANDLIGSRRKIKILISKEITICMTNWGCSGDVHILLSLLSDYRIKILWFSYPNFMHNFNNRISIFKWCDDNNFLRGKNSRLEYHSKLLCTNHAVHQLL